MARFKKNEKVVITRLIKGIGCYCDEQEAWIGRTCTVYKTIVHRVGGHDVIALWNEEAMDYYFFPVECLDRIERYPKRDLKPEPITLEAYERF